MADGPPGADHRKPLLERLAALVLRVPEDREQLLDLLRQAHERALLDAEAMSMIEGVLQVSELTARDIMVPRAEMDVIDLSQPPDAFLPKVIASGHSRFPVVDGDRDNVVGILDAKALLRLCADPSIDLRTLLRPAVFVPESRRLNRLMRDLRAQRAHLAIVVDEYGGTAGLITLEDTIEPIVGEFDLALEGEPEEADIVRVETAPNGASRYRVRASVRVDAFNEAMGTALPEGSAETLGALVGERLGRAPRRGERVEIDGVRFEVLRADAAQALLLRTEQLPEHGNGLASFAPAHASPAPVPPPAAQSSPQPPMPPLADPAASTVGDGRAIDGACEPRTVAARTELPSHERRGERIPDGNALNANARTKMLRGGSRARSPVVHGG